MPKKGSQDETSSPALELKLKTVASRLRESRLKAGLTQYELADQAGVRQSYIYELESGGANITIKTLFRMSELLKVDPRDLLPEGESQPASSVAVSQLESLLERVLAAIEDRTAADERRRIQEADFLTELRTFATLRHSLEAPPRSSGTARAQQKRYRAGGGGGTSARKETS